MCGDSRLVRNDTMIDPEQVAEVRANTGLFYDTTLPGNAGRPSNSFGKKMTGISEDDLLASSPESSRSSEADDDCERTDLEVSKYPFVERLEGLRPLAMRGEGTQRSVHNNQQRQCHW